MAEEEKKLTDIEQSCLNILDILEAQDNYCLIQDDEELPTELQFLLIHLYGNKDCEPVVKKLSSVMDDLRWVKEDFNKPGLDKERLIRIDTAMKRLRKTLTDLLTGLIQKNDKKKETDED